MRHQQKNKEIAFDKKPKKEDGHNNNGGGGKNKKVEDGIIRAKDGSTSCCIPLMKCSRIGQPLPQTLKDGIKLSCTNADCLYSKHLVHPECFRSLESSLMKLVTSQGYKYCRTRGILLSEEMLWEPRGLALIQKNLKCECKKGVMKRDDEAWAKREAMIKTPAAVEEKEKKKHKSTKALPTLQLTVKKGAAPPPNFHKLDTHYLSSHSPPPSDDDTTIEDKYGPPAPPLPSATAVQIKPTPPATTVSIKPNPPPTSNRALLTKTSIINESAIKKPTQNVPIGYDPLDVLFSSSTPMQPLTNKLKIDPGLTTLTSKRATPLNSNLVSSSAKDWVQPNSTKIKQPSKPKVVVAHDLEQQSVNFAVKSKRMKGTVEIELKKSTVELATTNRHTLEPKASPVLKREETPLQHFELYPVVTSTSKISIFNADFNSNLKSVAIQTDESCFHQAFAAAGQYQYRKSYSSKDSCGSDTPFSMSPQRPRTRFNFPPSENEFISRRHVTTTTSSGFGSLSDYSSFQPASPMNEVFEESAVISFIFNSDETCGVEIYENGKREKLKNLFGSTMTPMYFSMAEGSYKVGEGAHLESWRSPKSVVYDIMKIVGKSMNEIQINPKWDFKVLQNNGRKCFEIETPDGFRLFPEDSVIAAFLKALKSRAENHLNSGINEIYLSSDFNFSESQKNVFKNAALKIGLNILAFV